MVYISEVVIIFRNILSLEMLTTLRDNLKSAITSEETQSIVLRSTGVCFCAGHDLKELVSKS